MFYNVDDDAQTDAPASEAEAYNFEDSDENDNAARGQTSRCLLIIPVATRSTKLNKI